MSISIIGLGAGDISQISHRAVEELRSGKKIYLRTSKHPVVDLLGIEYESFDSYYDQGEKFEEVYDRIAQKLVDLGKDTDIIYAVPGHPRVAETSVGMVEDYSRVKGVDVDVIASMSFIDAMYNYLAFDPSEGFRLLDAFNIEKRDLSIDSNIIITQVYDRYIASNIKLMLMDYYHDDQKVWIVKSAGIKGMEHKKELDLYDLDREENYFDHLTSLYIPKGGNKKTSDVYDIVKGMDIGDIERVSLEDNPGMVNYTQEIDYRLSKLKEGLDRIKDDDLDDVMDLVGQGLMDILEVCEIGKDEGLFDLDEICERLKK
ncbi:diphthine synthase [Peptostreptococcus anaerobius]|uniref:Diphthine synthase n=1 Tax=Peptostreptococcus anaerobius TaxID=1261 RepID=A0A379CF14_9FIRM|nr:SAM-dependent methyltransferase [Peptostreptococcus anaerobius]EKX93916.1 tetrapyrrole methylase [Peptostreptococcus anaerobius VPI 4330 = DSM 2949]SFN02427.1 Tetrapyrrole (Corrin/Porphyrin) Methylases [Peptostreptococcus anaerobius]SUB60237.1 diphthine synthase [Peptostreptococcus anaerobius]